MSKSSTNAKKIAPKVKHASSSGTKWTFDAKAPDVSFGRRSRRRQRLTGGSSSEHVRYDQMADTFLVFRSGAWSV
jgi:hypothetical protein